MGVKREGKVRIILRWTLKKREGRGGELDWIDLPQDSDKRRAFVNTVMNLWVPQSAGNFLTS
jgi:hypothetical protein